MGWYVEITTQNGYRWQYGHMDPSTTPPGGTVIQPGQYIGEYADPTNGNSSGPHVHLQLRDPGGTLVDPGRWSPIPSGCITSPWGKPRAGGPHGGVDYQEPEDCKKRGDPPVGGDDLSGRK
jgi:murein DD-endopeptidase MepM/ murein hydrolase activator NlpD